MNNDFLFFSDKVYIIPCKESKSKVFLQEKDGVESRTLNQFDNLSYQLELGSSKEHEKLPFNDDFILKDASKYSEPENKSYKHSSTFDISDIYEEIASKNHYKIISPTLSETKVGDEIYFECALVTDNSLSEENFEDIVWISDLDGLIGVNNKFKTMLSLGEHTISIVVFAKNSQNQIIKVIKDEIKITVCSKINNSPEIK